MVEPMKHLVRTNAVILSTGTIIYFPFLTVQVGILPYLRLPTYSHVHILIVILLTHLPYINIFNEESCVILNMCLIFFPFLIDSL